MRQQRHFCGLIGTDWLACTLALCAVRTLWTAGGYKVFSDSWKTLRHRTEIQRLESHQVCDVFAQLLVNLSMAHDTSIVPFKSIELQNLHDS